MKPLGIKNYGSIAHLPGSRMGPGDHACHEGQERICLEKARDKHDTIIIQEKLDGSNVGVCKVDGKIQALTRSGYLADTSPYEQHHKFNDWVWEVDNWKRFDSLLEDGERIVGEWLIQAHGTKYRLPHEPFVAFDLMQGHTRLPWADFTLRVDGIFKTPFLVDRGNPRSIEWVMQMLGTYGHHGALDPIEGAVWRVERKGKVDFLAKYVRPDKVDGKYLESQTEMGPLWNEFKELQ